MKQLKLMAIFFLFCGSLMAGTADSRPVFYDGTNFWTTLGGATNLNSIVTTTSNGLVYVDTTTPLQQIKVENCLDDESQAFTAAAGFETVTNLTTSINTGFTATHSNIVPTVTGDYLILETISFSSSVNNVLADGHFFTNGVEISRIGWSRKISVSGDQGSAAACGLINIAAGVNCEYKIDTDKNVTFSFDHFSWVMILQNE